LEWQKVKKVSEYKWLPVNDDKNGKDEERGKNQSQEAVSGIEQEFSTDIIRHTLGGCCEEYRGEQKTIKWPLPLETPSRNCFIILFKFCGEMNFKHLDYFSS